jgi:hypothetical protein
MGTKSTTDLLISEGTTIQGLVVVSFPISILKQQKLIHAPVPIVAKTLEIRRNCLLEQII